MKGKSLSVSEIYAKGRINIEKSGSKWQAPLDSKIGAAVRVNRKYLDSLFFEPAFFDPVEVDTCLRIFSIDLKTPVFCSPLSQADFMSHSDLAKIAEGVKNAGAMMMLGISSVKQLQGAIDTGAPVVRMVKPYRRTELIYKKARDAERMGCVAIGMDIDHFYGVLKGTKVIRAELFGPQSTAELKQLISQTKLPFVIKGVLSVRDAEKAAELGASAIIVSNHGSSSVDFTLPSMVALPKIADSGPGNKYPLLIDTGFKTGNDVFKAIAMGATAVGFASSMLLAFAADGAYGVETLIRQITAELSRTMAATGCPNLSAIKDTPMTQLPHIWRA